MDMCKRACIPFACRFMAVMLPSDNGEKYVTFEGNGRVAAIRQALSLDGGALEPGVTKQVQTDLQVEVRVYTYPEKEEKQVQKAIREARELKFPNEPELVAESSPEEGKKTR